MPVAGCSLIRPCKMPPVDMCIFDLGEAWPLAVDIGYHLEILRDDVTITVTSSALLIHILVKYFGLESSSNDHLISCA